MTTVTLLGFARSLQNMRRRRLAAQPSLRAGSLGTSDALTKAYNECGSAYEACRLEASPQNKTALAETRQVLTHMTMALAELLQAGAAGGELSVLQGIHSAISGGPGGGDGSFPPIPPSIGSFPPVPPPPPPGPSIPGRQQPDLHHDLAALTEVIRLLERRLDSTPIRDLNIANPRVINPGN